MLRHPPQWTKKIRPTVVAFLILFGFSFYGLHQNSRNSNATHRLAVRVEQNAKIADYNKCVAINKSYVAVRASTEQTQDVEIRQVKKLGERFKEAAQLNPPKTPEEAASYAAGGLFFEQLVNDTTEIAQDGTRHVFDITKPLVCGDDPSK